jgi:hypothetical protein
MSCLLKGAAHTEHEAFLIMNARTIKAHNLPIKYQNLIERTFESR